jgi:hypothetical protein
MYAKARLRSTAPKTSQLANSVNDQLLGWVDGLTGGRVELNMELQCVICPESVVSLLLAHTLSDGGPLGNFQGPYTGQSSTRYLSEVRIFSAA